MSVHNGHARGVDRRRLLVATGATAAGAALFGTAGVVAGRTPAAAGALATDPFVAYHGVDGGTHQQRFNELVPQGYRMISLSVYGSPARYAAVWVRRTGPAWAAAHGLSAAQYQDRFNELTGQGFVPVLVSATGPSWNPVFAAVFEQISAPAWLARHGLVDGPANIDGTLANANQWAQDNNLIPRTVAVYGSGAGDRAYAGVWLPNPTRTKWQHHPVGNGAEYQGWFNAYTQVPMRPAFLDANDGLQYAALFTDDSVGTWSARHGMTGAEYQAEFDRQAAAGRMPIYVQGGGTGSGTRYAALFAERDRPLARQWTRTNAVGAGFTGVHDTMKSFMQTYGVRAGVLSVRRNGVSRLSSGYTWAEPGYPVTQPTSLLRLASVSKAFAVAAIRALVADRRLSLGTAAYPLLGITSVALVRQTRDPRIDTVTVGQLVEHQGGWDRAASGLDPVFAGRAMALELGLSSHVTKRDVARYMYGEPLQFEPGDKSVYSNFGYVLLALVVEKVTGQSFQNYLKQRVLAPLGVADQVWTGATLRSGRRGTEVRYDDASVGESAWDPRSSARVPTCYGTFLIAEMDGGGGLIASAPAVTAFINRNPVFATSGGRTAGTRAGFMSGTVSEASSRADGIDWCFIFNAARGEALGQFTTDLNNAITAAGI